MAHRMVLGVTRCALFPEATLQGGLCLVGNQQANLWCAGPGDWLLPLIRPFSFFLRCFDDFSYSQQALCGALQELPPPPKTQAFESLVPICWLGGLGDVALMGHGGQAWRFQKTPFVRALCFQSVVLDVNSELVLCLPAGSAITEYYPFGALSSH